MTKRNNCFHETSAKKSKLDLDDLWGEDFDDDEIEACVLKATQVHEDDLNCTEINNVSLLPSYNAFKQAGKHMFTSTQNHCSQVPSTSRYNSNQNGRINSEEFSFKRPHINNNELRSKLSDLENEIEEKNGENSILRSQLNGLQSSLKFDYEKKVKEVNDKLQNSVKEIQKFKTELQFKNLEILNLKNKIVELTYTISDAAANNNDVGTTSNCRRTRVDECDNSKSNESVLILRPTSHQQLPLKDRIDTSIFKTIDKNFYYKLHDELLPADCDTSEDEILQSYTYKKQNEKFSLNLIHANMAFLINSTTEEINNELNFHHIDHVVIMFKLLLINFYMFLKDIEENISLETIRKKDIEYLEKKIVPIKLNTSLYDSNEWCDNEIGTQLRQIMTFISDLLPFSKYVQEIILQRKEYVLRNCNCKVILDAQNLQRIVNMNILDVIMSCVTLVGSMRKAKTCAGFLCSVLNLLSKANNFQCNSINEISANILKEIICSRPNEVVLYYLSIYLKGDSLTDSFANLLCSMSMSSLKKNSKKVIYFDSKSCLFQIFNVLYRDCILKCEGEKNNVYFDMNLNMLKFFANIFSSKFPWLYYKENNHCNCLTKLCELVIEIIYELCKCCDNDNEGIIGDIKLCEIRRFTMNILHILNFKYYNLIEKYLHSCSQFKVILHILQKWSKHMSEEDCNLLKQLMFDEEDMKIVINEDNFNNISLWA